MNIMYKVDLWGVYMINVLNIMPAFTEPVQTNPDDFGMGALFIIIICLILGGELLVSTKAYKKIPGGLKKLISFLKIFFGFDTVDENIEDSGELPFEELINASGFDYDPKQDIFYSIMDPWQRKMGYCRLYDEACAPMGMIVDCEPVHFNYKGKRWMIEFWKGQYDLVTGAELGIYYTDKPDIEVPGIFKGPFFKCVSNSDRLRASFVLRKNGKNLFLRSDLHWWLTGFVLGEFSEPHELTMHINITLKDEVMRDAFLSGLIKTGYSTNELKVSGNTVSFVFDKPRSLQPITRTTATDKIIQKKNKLMCEAYQKITGPYKTIPEKIEALKQKDKELYNKIMNRTIF